MSKQIYENDPKAKAYFDSLPILIQESIKQSGMELQTQEQLREFAEHLTKQ